MKKKLDEELSDLLLNKQALSRRDAIKLMGISPIAAGVLASTSGSSIAQASVDVKGKIVIVGGGSGAIMALSRLCNSITNPDITIIAPNEIHLYQPGQVFIASGLLEMDDIKLDNNDWIDQDKVTWIKDEVESFDADNNLLVTREGEEVSYDYLVVATGIQYHYEKIKGLKKEDIGKNGISSVYLNDLERGTAKGATATWNWYNELKEVAKTKKPKVIYTQPNTPIKCGGAPQKILYLSADYLKKDGLSAEYTFATAGGKLFSLSEIDEALHETQEKYDTITNKFNHNLVAVDVDAKQATFEYSYEEKGAYDEDIEEYEIITRKEEVVLDYDFLHVVPPMGPVDAVMNSSLGWQKGSAEGWLEVDKHTLQHRRYENVFGIGDICGIPKGKTGGSARHHGPILEENLLAVMQGKEPTAKFDGYTVCPLKTEYGKIIMAEFNYDGPAPSFPLAYEKPRWIWWAFDLYMLAPMYKYLMLPGRM